MKVENLRLSTWNDQVSGNVSDETTFTITGKEIDTTKAVLPKKSNIVSSVTPVKGFKDFSITCKCINRNTTELYLIYLEMALSNKRRSQKHGGFYVTGGYLADKECGVGTSWRGTTPLKQYIVTLGKAQCGSVTEF